MAGPVANQKWVVLPFLMIQRVPSSQIDLAFKRLFQVRDFLLEVFKVSRYFFLKVSTQILPAFVRNSHNFLARRALFWLMLFVTPRPLRCFGFAITSQLIACILFPVVESPQRKFRLILSNLVHILWGSMLHSILCTGCCTSQWGGIGEWFRAC